MRFLLAAAVASLALAGPAVSAEKLVTKPSKHSVKATMDKLAAALEAKGIKPVARIDHAAAAKANGLDLTRIMHLFEVGTALIAARTPSCGPVGPPSVTRRATRCGSSASAGGSLGHRPRRL